VARFCVSSPDRSERLMTFQAEGGPVDSGLVERKSNINKVVVEQTHVTHR